MPGPMDLVAVGLPCTPCCAAGQAVAWDGRVVPIPLSGPPAKRLIAPAPQRPLSGWPWSGSQSPLLLCLARRHPTRALPYASRQAREAHPDRPSHPGVGLPASAVMMANFGTLARPSR